MKKILSKLKHNTLFGIIIGIILCSGIVNGVNTYKSETIQYSPTDSSWNVKNVSEAINNLYEMQKTRPTTENPDFTKTKGLLKIVYLDPTDLTKECNATNSVSTTGTKEGCMKWYAYKDDGTSYTMILDHNTTPIVAYNSTGSNTEMKEVKIALENDTKNWKQTARLITANEIAEITGARETLDWTSDKPYADTPIKGTSISWFVLDGINGTDATWHTLVAKTQGSSKYAWVFDNTNGCTNYGCNINDSSNYGYWTSTPVAYNSGSAWNVNLSGYLQHNSVDLDDHRGVRPVITISKSILK